MLVRFPEFQSRTRRVAGKPRHAHRRSLIERFPDSSSNPESGPNSPPTVNNSQASPTAAANAAAAIQEVSIREDALRYSPFLYFSLSRSSFAGDGKHRLRGSIDQQQSAR